MIKSAKISIHTHRNPCPFLYDGGCTIAVYDAGLKMYMYKDVVFFMTFSLTNVDFSCISIPVSGVAAILA